jgi:3-methyladenine DNA glycosylase AlkD
MQKDEILRKLKSMGNEKDRAGMSRYGINVKNAYGVSVFKIRELAKPIKRDHELARNLWKTGIHEARILAGFLADPKKMNANLMESWVRDFDSWDICDLVCAHLFDRTYRGPMKAVEWASRKEEFVKRAGFVLMASLSVHAKYAPDEAFKKYLAIVKRESTDERNYVKKSVNWALRQIGKRNIYLNKEAIKTAKQIQKIDSKTARWIASDALRELKSDKVQERLSKKRAVPVRCE